MASSFKKGATVRYTTPRGGKSGTGRIKAIHETARGVWYEVVDAATKLPVKLRAASLSAAV